HHLATPAPRPLHSGRVASLDGDWRGRPHGRWCGACPDVLRAVLRERSAFAPRTLPPPGGVYLVGAVQGRPEPHGPGRLDDALWLGLLPALGGDPAVRGGHGGFLAPVRCLR